MIDDRDSRMKEGNDTPDRQTTEERFEWLKAISRNALLLTPTRKPTTLCAYCFTLYGSESILQGCTKCGYDYDPLFATAKRTGHHHLLLALALAARFGGSITSDLISHSIWPQSPDLIGQKFAQHLLRRAVKNHLLVARKAGPRQLVFVLTKSGASWVEAKPATSWGRTDAMGRWSPPANFQHHLAAARYLVNLMVNGWTVSTWFEFERANPNARKKPDGIAVKGSSIAWIEAERARKTGPAGRSLGGALLLAAIGLADRLALQLEQNPFAAPRANEAVVLVPARGFKDDRGCNINHKLRVTKAVRRAHQAICLQDQGDIVIRVVTEMKPWHWSEEVVRVQHDANDEHAREVF